jgi:hypothetical protein
VVKACGQTLLACAECVINEENPELPAISFCRSDDKRQRPQSIANDVGLGILHSQRVTEMFLADDVS